MDHYLDLKVLPDPEFAEQQLLNALFAKLHRALGQHGDGEVGVSFPDHGARLGSRLRLHGTAQRLDQFMALNWIQGMRDYCAIGELLPIPAQVQYRAVRRVQAKSAYNKRKRSITKGWLSEAEALKRIPDTQQKKLTLPYIQLRSLSNGNPMRIYIEHGPLQDAPQSGCMSTYGLSATATIPWF
ncbi:type I-F CRISPR-associated endoribonuclease Cas6/Csy4 [Marinobacterium nitratireducens]|uniref:Type I-F CRISPR-associated endoribonuclease Cas6/Csy4 n=1 Tax=Marinobacterium nitratireducens TaxID=518897 RepID=A0A918DQH5_9GAMM|nr:type I-F CRISPR-associated endoribonuclease Cas6/Csy4 [Marinobacterium nitratireducens]GGO80052.1 type I-F CRISPR-associated endoribonuclease Cas6/Csy4 [Marinobacterium nitratireducens]